MLKVEVNKGDVKELIASEGISTIEAELCLIVKIIYENLNEHSDIEAARFKKSFLEGVKFVFMPKDEQYGCLEKKSDEVIKLIKENIARTKLIREEAEKIGDDDFCKFLDALIEEAIGDDS